MAFLHLTCGFGCPPTDYLMPTSFLHSCQSGSPKLQVRLYHSLAPNPSGSYMRKSECLSPAFHVLCNAAPTCLPSYPSQGPLSQEGEIPTSAREELSRQVGERGLGRWGLSASSASVSPQAPPPVKREKARARPSRCWGPWGLRKYASHTNKYNPKELVLRSNNEKGKAQTNFH